MAGRGYWLVDGRADRLIEPDDRGLTYGDGLFETIAFRDGVPRLLDRHLARLAAGCARLGIPAPAASVLRSDIGQLVAGHGRGTLKLIVTRGRAGRGYAPPAAPQPTRVVAFWAEEGSAPGPTGELVMCSTPASANPALAGLKTLNRLDNVLARAELQARGAPEGLMSDTAGRIIGATMANVFLVKNGALLTPQLDCCGVHGIMRALVLELAALSGIRALETAIDKDAVASADEIFLTNALTGLRPVRRCAGRELALGPVTRRLAAALRAHGVEEALE